MAGSFAPLPQGFSLGLDVPLFSSRSPGTLGINDAGDPTLLDCMGDTPGSLGFNDLAAEVHDAFCSVPPSGHAGDPSSVTLAELGQIVSTGAAIANLAIINDALKLAAANTPARKAAFLAQVAEETSGLTTYVENGSDAYFTRSYNPGTDSGGNVGNTVEGDGPRFRGRGLLQLTGRENYTRAWIHFGYAVTKDPKNKLLWKGVDPDDPTLAADPKYLAQIAGWYWTTLRPGTNPAADKLEHSKHERATFVEVTKAVNGGTNGLDVRLEYYKKAKHALNITWGTLHLDLTPHRPKKKNGKKVAKRKP